MRAIFSSCLASFAAAAATDHWAVIVGTGSDYDTEYAYQSDASTAYGIIQQQGIPDSNIIFMTTNNMADNQSNPIQGNLFNWPTAANSYNASQIDYSGENVTAAHFLAVLKGDDNASDGGPVLKSNSQSKIFVFYSGPGYSEAAKFPYGPNLLNSDLIDAINYMDMQNMYNEMVIYWSMDYSGGMFLALPTDINVYAVTSASAFEAA